MCSIIRSIGTISYSLLFLNSRIGFNGLKYLYSVISVIDKRLPGNTKKWTLVRSWTARVRLVHSWAVRVWKVFSSSQYRFQKCYRQGGEERCVLFIDLFLQKSRIIIGSFARRDLQFKASFASSPACI